MFTLIKLKNSKKFNFAIFLLRLRQIINIIVVIKQGDNMKQLSLLKEEPLNKQKGFFDETLEFIKNMKEESDYLEEIKEDLSSLKNKWQEQNILIGEFRTKIEQLESSLSSVNSKNKLNNLKIQIQALKNEASTILKANKIQLSIDTGSYDSTVESLINRTNQ